MYKHSVRLYSLSSRDITNIFKNLVKTTGNGPFASKFKLISLNSELGASSTSLVIIPANSLITVPGSIILLCTSQEKYLRLADDVSIIKRKNEQQIVSGIPLNILMNNAHNVSSKIAFIDGQQCSEIGAKTGPQDGVEWKVFSGQNVLGYNAQSNGSYSMAVGYDGALHLTDNETIYLDEKSLIAIGAQHVKCSVMDPKVYSSLLLSRISDNLRNIWSKLAGLPVWNTWKGVTIFQKQDREWFNKNVRNRLVGVRNAYRTFIKSRKQRLVEVTGPATVLIKK